MEVMISVNFVLSSKNKDELRNLYNYLNQKVRTAINTLNGSTLGDYLLFTSHQLDWMSSALIPAEAIENKQEHFVANKVSGIKLLV